MTNFSSIYPNPAAWTRVAPAAGLKSDRTTIPNPLFARGLDMGGMVWEGKPKYKSVDAALDDLEAALENTMK